jgi:hypothetical protein
VDLDCGEKYQDFKRLPSAPICLEDGLAVIEQPKVSKRRNRVEYLGERNPPTVREKLRYSIDDVLPLYNAATRGCEAKRGKCFAFKFPEEKKIIRCGSLRDDYSEAVIRERLSGLRVIVPKGCALAFR